MQKNVFIYNEQLKVVARPFIDSIEEFKLNPEKYYPNWAVNMYFSEFELTNPKLDAGELREKTREELIFEDNKLDLLVDGEYIEGGKIIKVEYNKELGYLKPVWNRELKQWLEGATQEEQLEAQYKEYYSLNNPLRVDDMKEQGLYEEWRTMMLEMEKTLYGVPQSINARIALFVQPEIDEVDSRTLFFIPKASKELEAYKNKFKKGVI